MALDEKLTDHQSYWVLLSVNNSCLASSLLDDFIFFLHDMVDFNLLVAQERKHSPSGEHCRLSPSGCDALIIHLNNSTCITKSFFHSLAPPPPAPAPPCPRLPPDMTSGAQMEQEDGGLQSSARRPASPAALRRMGPL